MSPVLLLTGPIGATAPWLRAVRDAGWEAVEWPLIEIEPLDVDLVARIDGLPDWLCLTSKSALPAVEAACRALPELRSVPAAVVGPATADAMESAGFKVALQRDEGARALAEALLAELGETRAGKRVLWPRGSLTDELAQALREGGLTVDDPVVYRTRPVPHDAPPPPADAVFLASPSAARAWPADAPHPRAIAIGPSTLTALEDRGPGPFQLLESLPAPTPRALTRLLRGE